MQPPSIETHTNAPLQVEPAQQGKPPWQLPPAGEQEVTPAEQVPVPLQFKGGQQSESFVQIAPACPWVQLPGGTQVPATQ